MNINKYGNTPLHLACKHNRFVKELIDANITTVYYNNIGKQAIDNLKITSSDYNLLKTTKRDEKKPKRILFAFSRCVIFLNI